MINNQDESDTQGGETDDSNELKHEAPGIHDGSPTGAGSLSQRWPIEPHERDDPRIDEVGEFGEVPLEGLHDIDPQGILTQQSLAIREAFHSGPLPPPEVLQGYEDVVPGAARLILEDFDRRSRAETDAINAAAGFDRAKSDSLRDLVGAQVFGIRVGTIIGVLGVGLIGFASFAPALDLPVQ